MNTQHPWDLVGQSVRALRTIRGLDDVNVPAGAIGSCVDYDAQEAACRALLELPLEARITVLRGFCSGCGRHDSERAGFDGPCLCDVDPE